MGFTTLHDSRRYAIPRCLLILSISNCSVPSVNKQRLSRNIPTDALRLDCTGRDAIAYDPTTLPNLKLRPADTGLGNRIGWFLSAAALGRALNRSVITYWSASGSGRARGGHAYGIDVIRRAVAWPKVLCFVEHDAAWSETAGLVLPERKQLLKAAVDDTLLSVVSSTYVPNWSWLLWTRHSAQSHIGAHRQAASTPSARLTRTASLKRGGAEVGSLRDALAAASRPSASACLTRQAYLSSYRAVQDEVRALVGLCNPEPQSYVAVHSRRTDRDDPTAVRSLMAGVALRSLQTVSAGVRPLPFLVVSDSDHHTAAIEAYLESQRFAVVRRPRHCEGPAWQNASRVAAETMGALRDWFALSASAGVLVDVGGPWGSWAESSFSTTAALVGHTPLFTTRSPEACRGRDAVPRFSGACAKPHELPDVPHTFAARDASVFARAACRTSMGRCQVKSLAEQKAALLAREAVQRKSRLHAHMYEQ